MKMIAAKPDQFGFAVQFNIHPGRDFPVIIKEPDFQVWYFT